MNQHEYTIGYEQNADSKSIHVSVDRLSIIGYIGIWSNRLGKFPLPMLALDGEPEITRYKAGRITRVAGLLPSEVQENHLVRGSLSAQVDIHSDYGYGTGEVYLGNANTPSTTYGVIFHNQLPFDPRLELGFVMTASQETPLGESRFFNNKPAVLIYAEPSVLDRLGRVHTK